MHKNCNVIGRNRKFTLRPRTSRKEKERGRDTGDYVCTRCGKAGWGKDWNKAK